MVWKFNYQRFESDIDAKIAFLNEEWLISVSNLDNDSFENWTDEMKMAFSRWIFKELPQNKNIASKFKDDVEAKISFLKEVMKMDIESLDEYPFKKWTDEMQIKFTEWLFEKIS